MVVTHSLSGAYGALLASRIPVAGLVHISPAPTGIFYREDAPMRATRQGFPWPSEDSRGVGAWDADAAIRAIYPRLDAETAAAMAAGLVPGAGPSDLCPIDAHPDVPARLLYAEHDEFFNPDWERWLARTVVGVEAEELATGHFPMLEAPASLAAILMRD